LVFGGGEDLVDVVVEGDVGSVGVVEYAVPIVACKSSEATISNLELSVRNPSTWTSSSNSLGWKASE
jgi:hypothetical protein